MCAIIDASRISHVFGRHQGEAADRFLKWLVRGPGGLVVGGKLRQELARHNAYQEWQRQGLLSGRVKSFPDAEVDQVASNIKGKCQSNDNHVIALAIVSGARLLYTGDRSLVADFKDPRLIASPRGVVYYVPDDDPALRNSHKQILARTRCR